MTDETNAGLAPEGAPAPVETAPPETAQLTTEQETPPDDAGTPERKPQGGGFGQRIKELSDDKNQLRQDRDYWRDVALSQRASHPQQQQYEAPPQDAEPLKKPTRAEYEFDDERYDAALIEYAAKMSTAAVRRQLAAEREAEARRSREETFIARLRDFAKRQPDLDLNNITRADLYPVSDAMADVLKDSDSGPELLYWIGQNREDAARIARLPPHLAALELGRILRDLQATQEAKAAAAKAPVVTKAPPPPPVVEETDTTVPTARASSPDSDSLSDAEWMRQREKELKRQQKR